MSIHHPKRGLTKPWICSGDIFLRIRSHGVHHHENNHHLVQNVFYKHISSKTTCSTWPVFWVFLKTIGVTLTANSFAVTTEKPGFLVSNPPGCPLVTEICFQILAVECRKPRLKQWPVGLSAYPSLPVIPCEDRSLDPNSDLLRFATTLLLMFLRNLFYQYCKPGSIRIQ